jgi:transposase
LNPVSRYKKFLHVEYFPSYSPEPNPAEQSWRETKKGFSKICRNNKEELKKQLEFAFKQDFFVKARIYEYLRS